ncbi:MAG: NTP transferase domain-containing protein [Clostridia bacterium]|nr:NTP transferase domain-containing protein [Clostridia bacterium]
MTLSKKQFDILVYMESKRTALSQREIAEHTDISLGTTNKLMTELSASGLIENGAITEAGINALEPYRVKRAVFMAAGFGSRLVPITLNTPKPLVRVKGKRIIDSLLDAVTAIGIEEIYLVRGYLSEQFDQLLLKYPTIKFIENKVFNETNNISSAYCARHLLKNSYVFESDLLLYNPKLITKYQYSTNYLGVPTNLTEDWCFNVNSAGYIKNLALGGTNCYHMFGISYWNDENGARLEKDIEKVYNLPGGKQLYWDQVALDHCIDHYKISVRPCTFADIIEIDTFNELKQLDPVYNM